MTNNELKDALMSEYPVKHNGIAYKKVNAVIYRNSKGKLHITAELLDKSGRSVTIANSSYVEKEEKE